MAVAEGRVGLLSDPVDDAIETGGINESALLTAQSETDERRDRWQELIDHTLIEWGRNPAQLEDDGLEAPSPGIIQRACYIAECLRDGDTPVPLRIVPDGEGGIVFERRDGPKFISLEIAKDGAVELIIFHDGKVASRQRLF